jgi:hypothetical protein
MTRPVRTVAFVLGALLWAAATEGAVRAYWRLSRGVPFRDPGRVLYAYYPEMILVDAVQSTHDDGQYDILFLGGSALHAGFGEIAQVLMEQLAAHGHHDVRIFNLAMPAHTSRDSWLKYAHIDARFDLVVVYHGINDARANNVPPDLFREDYSHLAWYEEANALAPYHGTARFALPYTLHYMLLRVRHLLRRDGYAPMKAPRDDWVRYGSDPRSVESFERNLSAILDLAHGRGEPVLLMTSATYVPQDYSFESFQKKRLDYTLHTSAIEIWGKPENVLLAVERHNEVVRRLAARPGTVLFVDQARLMPGSSRYFNDVCHFTVTGSQLFVENLLPDLLPRLADPEIQ